MGQKNRVYTLNMNFKSVSNSDLHETLTRLAGEERRISVEILHYLREAEARRLYAERGHSSLFAYVVTELHYSESAAQRRISAMRALKGLPELEEKVATGELKVTQLAQVQSYIRSEKSAGKPVTQERRKELILATVGKSTRETERELAEQSPAYAHRDRIRALTPELTQVTFAADEELMTALQQVRDRFAHRLPVNASTADVVRFLAKGALERDPVRPKASSSDCSRNKKGRDVEGACAGESRAAGERVRSDEKVNPTIGAKAGVEAETITEPEAAAPHVEVYRPESPVPQNPLPAPQVRTRYIPIEVQRKVWKRDEGMCVFRSESSGRRCNSTHRLQIDHVVPFALGGSSIDPDQLRLLCA